ncbi:DotH/IcmK family type IV secretion protein [Marinobacter salarius]|uniref:Putative outer membrane core complex of type IVb secretion n=1 Tax=Marinobacter salarius TaxID=1420917 RepID=A0A1W6KFW7_9GAMM|nr:DotH/IcmK family type IV secretion protein [Marinobacter salarius]ARM86314.1 putative outer membrane core complex of type IVb secretion [Marinobacter salarius]
MRKIHAYIGAMTGTFLLTFSALSIAQEGEKGTSEQDGQPETSAVVSKVDLDRNSQPRMDPNIDLRKLPSDMDMLFPLSPEEKLRIRRRQMQDQEATYQPLRDVKPLRDLVQLSVNADRIPEVMVTPDYPTSVVFTDITGSPWPINYVAQTGSLAKVEQPSGTVNALAVFANNSAGRKSMSVYLKGMTLPVTLTVTGSSEEYHALKHVRINERGPNAPEQEAFIAGRSQSASSVNPMGRSNSDDEEGELDMILNKLAYKVTPDGFNKLKSSDPTVDAWIKEEEPSFLYIMTDYRMVSPAPRAGARSVTPLQDGVRIYIVPRINPVMALDKSGSRVYLSFKE